MASTYRPIQAGARHRIAGQAVNSLTGAFESLAGRTVFGVIIQGELEVQVEGDIDPTIDGESGFFFDVLPAVTIQLVPNFPATLRAFSRGETDDDILALGVIALSPK